MLENYVEILAVLATIFGSAMGLFYLPQAYKIYKNKSSAAVSVLTYFGLSLGLGMWIL